MALDATSGYASGAGDEASLPIFDVQRVQLQFDVTANFVAAQAANDVLVIALASGRILRFDLVHHEDIDDIDLPRRPAEIGVIRKLFLDRTASHLIISTTLGENFYLHTQSRQPKPLSKIKGVQIESVGWNPSQPTASTREILIGAADGSIYETYIDPNTEFLRKEERYVKSIYNPQAGPVVGLHIDMLSERSDTRRVMIATPSRLLHLAGHITRQGHEGSGSIYSRFFESETLIAHDSGANTTVPVSSLAVSPAGSEETARGANGYSSDQAYAWLCNAGIFHGELLTQLSDSGALGRQIFNDSKMLPQSKLPPIQTSGGRNRSQQPPISSVALSKFHILALVDGRVTAVNRLDGDIVYNQQILEPGTTNLGLFTDHQKNTYWLFTSSEIYEIVVTDEDRHIWKIMLKQGQYEAAEKYAKTSQDKDKVVSVTGDHFMAKSRYDDAAMLLGRSSKPFEDVALAFIDHGEQDALRKYLLVKLASFDKSFVMQRVMLTSWLLELYMAKLNEIDDTLATKAELTTDGLASPARETKEQLTRIRKEFQDFCSKNKSDLDRKTAYEIIGSHGREEELLFFANVVGDYNYVLSYWIQRERWQEAMDVLKKQTDPDMFYKHSSVLMTHTPVDLVEVLMRQSDLEAKKLIPALLNYNKNVGQNVSLSQNQAIRYLLFCINHGFSTEPAVHNTLISLYASNTTDDESALLKYLESSDQHYDTDFALRLCISHRKVRSCVHIYCTMKQYASAVDLAMKYDEVELAASVANRPEIDDPLRKKLWLKIAKKVIGREKGIKSAIEFLQRSKLLRIEDLIPFFPDFVVIDDFKEEICAALETYSRNIDALKAEMDDSAGTAQHIKSDIKSLDQRYAIVEPGERCWKCRLPLLMRQFFVFPCQHAFHADCLGETVMKMMGMSTGKRIRELQREIGMGVALGARRENMVKDLDGLVAGACVLCSEMAVKLVDEPFVSAADNKDEWAI